MDQDATQVRILRPPSRDENCVRPKLIQIMAQLKFLVWPKPWMLKEWYSYLEVKYLNKWSAKSVKQFMKENGVIIYTNPNRVANNYLKVKDTS